MGHSYTLFHFFFLSFFITEYKINVNSEHFRMKKKYLIQFIFHFPWNRLLKLHSKHTLKRTVIQILNENCIRIQIEFCARENQRNTEQYTTFECLTINYIMIHVMHFTKFYNSFTAMLGIVGCVGCRGCVGVQNSKPGSKWLKHVKSAISNSWSVYVMCK